MELDLNNLPPRLLAIIAKGDMNDVFKALYNKYSAIMGAAAPANNNSNNNSTNNNNNENEEDEDSHYTTIIMTDGQRIPFSVSTGSIKSEPYNEIVLDPGFDAVDINLISIHKSAQMTGTQATNYAISIAAAFGARSMHVLDTATVVCAGSPNNFPLSLYRVLVTDGVPSISWYVNVASKRGLIPNTTVASRLGFADAVHSLQEIRLTSLVEFYTAAKGHVDSGQAVKYRQYSMDGKGDTWQNSYDITDVTRPVIQSTLNSLITILSGSNEPTLGGFMKNPFTPCVDKAIVLRSLPGYNGPAICPQVLLNARNKKIARFPYIEIVLRVRATTQDPIIRLRGGVRTRRHPRKNLTRRFIF